VSCGFLAAVLGCSELARAAACGFALFLGGEAMVCGFAGELVFNGLLFFAYQEFPAYGGSKARGSARSPPLDLLYVSTAICTVRHATPIVK